LENLSIDFNELDFSKLIGLSNDLTQILDSSRCLRSENYHKLLEESPAIKSISELSISLDQYVDDPSRYEDAMHIIESIEKLRSDFSDHPEVFGTIIDKANKKRDYLLVNLCNHLDNQRATPVDQLGQIVQLLARCGRFSNRELRLRYLQARDHWFDDECECKSDSFDELIQFFSQGLPKIFEEYRMIFGAIASQSPDKYAPVAYDGFSKDDASIINSWLLLKTSTFLLSLELHLKSLSQSRLLTPTSIDDTMKKCFRLTNSLAAIGFDFGCQLRLLFLKSLKDEVSYSIERATLKFETEFTNILSKSIESLLLPIDDEILRVSNLKPEEKLPKSIEHYPVFKIYCLNIIDSLRWIRATQNSISSTCLCIDVYKSLNTSLSRVMQAITVMLNTVNNASHPILSKVSVLFLTDIMPFIVAYCDIIFPERLVLSAIGLSKSEFKALCTQEPEKVSNLRLHPSSLENFRRHVISQTGGYL